MHIIFQMNSAIFNVVFNVVGISGNFGAGGKTGNSRLTVGNRVGGSGNCGGFGSSGILGIFTSLRKDKDSDMFAMRSSHNFNWSSMLIFALYCGGSGRSGIFINAIFVGVKLNLGNKISIHKFMFDKSIIIFGILNDGIGNIGNHISGQSIDRLHEYESYVSFEHFPHLSDRFTEKSIKI